MYHRYENAKDNPKRR